MRRRRRLRTVFLSLAVLGLLPLTPFAVFSGVGGAVTCGEGTARTVRMPLSGENYRTYCIWCVFALRTFAREEVIASTLDSFEGLTGRFPDTTFVYGEIGWPWGGRFPPHRTHREGLSLDIMVPLRDGRTITTTLSNRYGFDAEFDTGGRGSDGEIDFEAMGAQLIALDSAARSRGGRVRRVFLAPDLQDDLQQHPSGAMALDRIPFNKRQSWVRHDDHYHIDFSFPCNPE